MPNNRNFVPITAAELRQAEQNTQAMLQNATAWVFNGTYTVDARNEGQEVVPIEPKDDFAKSLTPEQRGETKYGKLTNTLREALGTQDRLRQRIAQLQRRDQVVPARDQVFDDLVEPIPIEDWPRGVAGTQGA